MCVYARCPNSSIQGGAAFNAQSVVDKGRVANVTFAADFLKDQPQVASVQLSNLNLAPIASKLSAMLPLKLVNLSLDNGLFTAIPPGLSRFKSLSMLYDQFTCLLLSRFSPTSLELYFLS